MAGIWVRSGTIALTSGSKKVTGTGTSWNSGLNKVTKGCALKHNNIDYEVDYVNSDTELYLVDTYTGGTLSGQAYRIVVSVTDTIPELSSRIAQALAYWNGQGQNLQLMMSGSGNVTLTFPDGTQVTIPSWGNMQPKDGLLTAIANLTTSADKLFYATGADAVAMTTLSAKGRELIDDADASAMLTTLGVSTFIKSLLDDADAATALGTLGITKASLAETNSRLATDKVVTPAGLNAVVPYAPTINPTLDLDFAKQKYRWYAGAAGLTESSTPSLMTFTRSSIATFFDAMGVMKSAAVDTPRIDYDPITGECKGLLIEEARTNLLTYSSRFNFGSWTSYGTNIQNQVVAPDGTLTGTRIIYRTSGSRVVGAVTAISTSIVFSIHVKADVADNGCRLRMYNNTKSSTIGSTLVLSTIAGSGIDAGNGWRRVFLVATSGITVGDSILVYLDISKDGGIATTDSILAWGSQVEGGAFPTTYIPSVDTWTARASSATYYDSNGVLQTAASGVARSAAYDYDADGVLRPIGLLLEGAATNLLLYSEQFDNAAWTKSNTTITANAVVAPDGTATADKIVENSASGSHNIYQAQAVSASTAYVLSVHVQAAERSNIMLQCTDGTTWFNAFFDVNAGTITSQSSVTATIKKQNNGFYRCSIAFTTGASATSVNSYLYLSTGAGVSNYTGDGASGVYVWGAQLAAGNYATSYIATTSAQVTRAADSSTSAQATRAADNAVISGANFSQWFKVDEYSLFAEFVTNSLNVQTGYDSVAELIKSSSSRVGMYVNKAASNIVTIDMRTATANKQANSPASCLSNSKNKTVFSLNRSTIRAATNGSVSADSAVTAIPLDINQLIIGKYDSMANMHIRSLKYFPKTLAPAELQAMTA